jgi:hypothetical protein
MKLTVVTFAIAIVTSPALAQSRPDIDALADRWSADKQMHIPNSVRNFVKVAVTQEATGLMSRSTSREELTRALSGWLERFPTIHLVVQPAPPRDYSVAINGEDCPATERGLYKVPFGSVEVRVVRTGRPPCVWSGKLVDGRTQEVSCNF